jgi:general secretion pathway protein K
VKNFAVTRQSGVALIQVLLITSMLLILVVQLSKDAREQVQTSIRLKEKAELFISINDQIEQAKYELLTISPNQLGVSASGLNYFGEPVSKNNLIVEVQDQAGLLSLATSFNLLTQYLNLPQGTSAERRLLNTLLSWQGLEAFGNSPANFRGGLLHYNQEINQIPGWQDIESEDDGLIYYPLKFYNPVLSPEKVLNQLFSEDDVQSLLLMRASGVFDQNTVSRINRFSGENASVQPSNFVRLKVTGERNGMRIVREELVFIELGSVSLLTSLSL